MGSLRTLRRNSRQADFNSGPLCPGSEQRRNVSRQPEALFCVSEDHFSNWPPQLAEEVFERAQGHGCAHCYWQQELVCLQSEEETNFPQDCPGFKRG